MWNSFFTSIALSCLFLFGLILADDHGVVFLYPPSGLTVNYKDTVNVSYTSNFSNPQLITFCNEAGSNSIVTGKYIPLFLPAILTLNSELTSYPPAYNGSKTVYFEWPNAVLCWFDLRPDSSSGNGANSPSFTVLSSERVVSTVLGLPQATSSPSSTQSSSAATTTAAATTSATSDPKDGGSKHNKTGIIVGTVLSAISAIAFVVFLIFRRRKSKANTQYEPARDSPGVDGAQWRPGTENGGDQIYMKPMEHETVKPQELSTEVTHELYNETVRHEMNADSAVIAPPQPGHLMQDSTKEEKKRYSWQMTPTA